MNLQAEMSELLKYRSQKTRKELTAQLLQLFDKSVLEVIGTDEKNFDWKKNRGMKPDLATPARNKLRTEQRQTWNKIKSGEEKV